MAGQVSLYVVNHFCIVCRMVCSFCEAMPGSLSMANAAVLSANFAVADLLRLASLQYMAGITVAIGHCPVVHPH
jgi:hypothetical protein